MEEMAYHSQPGPFAAITLLIFECCTVVLKLASLVVVKLMILTSTHCNVLQSKGHYHRNIKGKKIGR